MTGKERIVKAFSNTGEPDRVPVEPGIDYDTLVDLSGLDYWHYKEQGHTELSGLIHWCDRLGFDLYHYSADLPVPNPTDECEVTVRQSEEGDVRVTETCVATSRGTVRQRRRYPRQNPEYSHEKFVKDIGADWPVLREYLGWDWPIEQRYFEEYALVGDRGAVGTMLPSPIDWWEWYRHGGVEQVVMDLLDEQTAMQGIMEYYRDNSMEHLRKIAALDPKPDFVMIAGSSSSMSVISPRLFEVYVLPYLREASTILKNAGILSLFHVCGKSRELAGYLADSDVNVMDALEAPPSGNVDLAEVKRLYGDRLCLKGNVPATTTMVMGTRKDVQVEVKRCIDSAAAGGGFMLCVGDSIGPKANLENIEEMVATALEYGRY